MPLILQVGLIYFPLRASWIDRWSLWGAVGADLAGSSSEMDGMFLGLALLSS